MAAKHTSKPFSISAAGPSHRYVRADIQFYGIDHSGASYQARIFFNNPKADENTPTTLENGYAGAFHIFGHGGCFGDEGHCEIREKQDSLDFRRGSELRPKTKRVTVTEALRRAVKTSETLVVTVVPVVTASTDKVDTDYVLAFDKFDIVTYNEF